MFFNCRIVLFCFFIPSDKLYLVGVREESKHIMQKVVFLASIPKTKDLCFLILKSLETGRCGKDRVSG